MNTYKIAASKLNNHGVIAFPTETVMGLGVIYDDYEAYNRLNVIKRRPEDKPYSLMIPNVEDITKYALVNEQAKKIINRFLPGPLTILLPAKNNLPFWVTHGSNVVGIRVPSHKITRNLLLEVNKPLLVPSANRSGEKPCMNSKEVNDVFNSDLDYIIDGCAEGGIPSTIIDLTGNEIKVIRQGEITLNMIKEALK